MTRPAWRHYPTAALPLVDDAPGARRFAVSLERAMLTYFEIEPHAVFAEHRHASEQITLVLTGELVFTVDGRDVRIGPGEAIALAGDVLHAVRAGPEPTTAVDAWSPPRPDYEAPE